MICVEIFVLLCQSYFVVLPKVNNQHLTAPNKRRRLEWCTSMLERHGEAKRPHSGTSHARHTFLAVSTPFFSQFSPTLQIFTPFFVVQFHAFPSQFLVFFFGREFGGLLVVSIELIACKLRETPAAPEVQLRDVVWSDEFFFLAARRAQPSGHQDLLGFALIFAVFMIHLARSDSLVHLQCREFQCSPFLSMHFWLFFIFLVLSQSVHKTHYQPVTPKDLLQRSMRLTMTRHRCG